MELCDVKARPDAGELTEQFWLTPIGQAHHPNIALVAKTLLTIFGSTYICESAFSTLTFIKSKHRSTLSDSHTTNLLRTALLDKCNAAAITNSKQVFNSVISTVMRLPIHSVYVCQIYMHTYIIMIAINNTKLCSLHEMHFVVSDL